MAREANITRVAAAVPPPGLGNAVVPLRRLLIGDVFTLTAGQTVTHSFLSFNAHSTNLPQAQTSPIYAGLAFTSGNPPPTPQDPFQDANEQFWLWWEPQWRNLVPDQSPTTLQWNVYEASRWDIRAQRRVPPGETANLWFGYHDAGAPNEGIWQMIVVGSIVVLEP